GLCARRADHASWRLVAERAHCPLAMSLPRLLVRCRTSPAGNRQRPHAEDTMYDELAARQRAISLRLAGRPVKHIYLPLGRSEAWFHKWWDRYLEAGPAGLYDLTRANHHVAQRISPELERSILSVRRRLQAHASPATRYSLIGAAAILAELKALDIHPLPNPRTIERVLQRNGLTAPRVRLAPLLPRQEWPGPQARASNGLHEVDLVGPIYL